MFPRKFALLALFVALAALMLSFGFGCGSDDSPTESNSGDDVTGDDDVIDDDDDDIINQDSVNRELSIELVAEANDSLARQMNEIINETIENADSSFRPGDIDFSGVNSMYEEALDLWSENLDAKFGVAFTGLMLFCADPELNDLIDEFKYYYDTMSFNPMQKVMLLPEVGLGRDTKMFPDGIPVHPGGMLEIMPAFAKLDNTLIATATAVPMISDIQYNLETSLLPKIIDTEGYLIDLLDNPDYTFTITPLMQGNPGSSPIEVDRSDFSLFLGVAYAAEAALHIFFARNLDVTDYTAEAVEYAINQGSDFLTLKDDVGQTHMTAAKNKILSAEAQFETTIDYLLDEIGTDQSYDLITVYPSDEADLNDIKDSLIHYRSFMDEVSELSIFYNKQGYWYWTGYEWIYQYTEDTLTLEVALWKFFDDPMDDPKEFIPGYTITLEAQEDYYQTFVAEHFDRQSYWDSLLSLYGLVYPDDVTPGEFPYFENHLPDEDNDEFYRLLGNYYDGRQFIFGWDDLQFWGGDPLQIWNYYSSNWYSYMRFYDDPDQLYACYEWTANTFEEWNFPDPTFNGLIPSLTNSELKDLILDDYLDWRKSDCDYLELEIDW